MPGVLALDPAITIGWAHADPGQSPTWGHQRLARPGAETDEVAEALAIFLEARIELFRPDWIVRENFYIGGGKVPMNPQTIFVLCGIAWQIDLVARQHGIECRKVQSLTFVNFFTGRAKYADRAAKKRATIQTCKLHGWRATEDEADALALLAYAEAKLFGVAAIERRAAMPFAAPGRL
jgi:hypothetical protein